MPQRNDARPAFTQNNYNATNVTGTGDIYSQYSAPVQLIQVLQQAVERDENIPEPEKKTLLQHFQDIINNPYFSGLVTGGAYDGLKAVLENFTR
jgi:hypothetical protein